MWDAALGAQGSDLATWNPEALTQVRGLFPAPGTERLGDMGSARWGRGLWTVGELRPLQKRPEPSGILEKSIFRSTSTASLKAE